jgi:hypothetical protein
VSTDLTGLDSNQAANVEELIDFMPLDQDLSGNGMFNFADMALSQGPLDMTGYKDFAGTANTATSSSGETMDESISHIMLSSMPWMDVSGYDIQVSPLEIGKAKFHKQHQELLPGPDQLPTPTLTAAQTIQSPQMNTPGMSNAVTPYQSLEGASPAEVGKVEDVLRALVDLLAQPSAWHAFPNDRGDATQILNHDARDRMVAAVQLLLHRALCQNRVVLSPSTHGAFGRIVALPPSHVLVHFIELYAARVDSIHPYLGLGGSPSISIRDILQVDMADIGILLLILLVAQGAMLTDHHESHILAYGLIELCKLALNDVLETRSIAQPMVGGCALQLLTLCAWSGHPSFASVRTLYEYPCLIMRLT